MSSTSPRASPCRAAPKTHRHIDGLLIGLAAELAERPRLVHRLDRETSGVLVIAKRRAVAASLGKLFATRTVRKIYWAAVKGVPKPRAGQDRRAAHQGGRAGRRSRARRGRGRRGGAARRHPLQRHRQGAAGDVLGLAQALDRTPASAARAHGAYRSSDRRRRQIWRRCRSARRRSPTGSISMRAASSFRIRAAEPST